jgi:hypothetical protein
MDGHAQDTAEQAPTNPTGRWRDLGLVALLLALALGVRGWLMTHTEVLARDSIGFIRYALEFQTDDWRKVLRNNHQHPGYPLTVLAVSVAVRGCVDAPHVELMTLSAQLASNLASVLLVIPMFYLGKLLFHRGAGFGAAAMFQCLPVCAHILSDGLSEPLFLLLTSSALVFAVLAMRGSSPWRFGLCGTLAGLAFLTRPEGLLVVAATLLVLLALQRSKAHRRSWRQVLVCGGSLTAAALLMSSPYTLVTHHLTNKPSGNQIFGKDLPELEKFDPALQKPQACAGRPLMASTLAVVLNLQDNWGKRFLAAVWYLSRELVKCFHYVAWLPALLGMWWYRRQARQVPGMWVLLVLCATLALVLCRLAVVVGYMSDRHLLLLVMCGTYAAAAAEWELPARLRTWLTRQAWSGGALSPVPHTAATAALAVLLLAGTIASALPKTLDTLHGNRAGHHAAGLWLAEHAAAADIIDDEHCWAHYYAGRVFLEMQATIRPQGYQPVRYVVIGRRDHDITQTFNRLQPVSEEKLSAQGGQIVYHWPAQGPVAEAAVVVYAVGLPRRN